MYVCSRSTNRQPCNFGGNLMRTLLQSNIQAVFEQNRPSEEWTANLNEHLPFAGEVTTDIPLVRIVDGEKKEVFLLRANEVCTDWQVRGINAFPPDGIWVKWGDLAAQIVRQVVPQLM